eukprot:930003-Amphidinium_carterae.1
MTDSSLWGAERSRSIPKTARAHQAKTSHNTDHNPKPLSFCTVNCLRVRFSVVNNKLSRDSDSSQNQHGSAVQSMLLSITLGVIPLIVLIGVRVCQKVVMSEINQIMKSAIRVSTTRNKRNVRSESQKNDNHKMCQEAQLERVKNRDV